MQFKPYTPDFQNGCYAREIHSLFEETKIHFADQGLALDYKSYKSGNTLLVFDVSTDLTDCDSYKLISKRGLCLELKFAKPLDRSTDEWGRECPVSLDYYK